VKKLRGNWEIEVWKDFEGEMRWEKCGGRNAVGKRRKRLMEAWELAARGVL
jgi:hypothetical protein